MKPRLSLYLTLLFLAMLPSGLASQELPALKTAEEVQSGTFPNGVSYYIVANNTSKGYANFALVQRDSPEKYHIRENLSSLPSFPKVSPYVFEASKGVGYTGEGYVKYPGNSSVFCFEDVPCFDSAALDSTIIMIFDIIRSHPGEQAVVVSGDVDPTRIKDRFYLLSLTVVPRSPASSPKEYAWKGFSGPRIEVRSSATRKLASITFSYASSRLPREQMGTPWPLVSSMFATELGTILQKRSEAAFAAAGIPLAKFEFDYRDSSKGDSDELYSFRLFVSGDDVAPATELFAGILSALDSRGAGAGEFGIAKEAFLAEALKSSDAPVGNRKYVDACISSYLYGSAILAKSAPYNFFKGRKLAQDRDLALFNRFVSALLDPGNNLAILYETPSAEIDEERMKGLFGAAWKQSAPNPVSVLQAADTVSLLTAGKNKVKLRAEAPDAVTGGKLWTFSNGMKVLFRQTSDSRIRYCWMLRGGYSEVPAIGRGESAFVEDMLGLCSVAGLSPGDFRKLLESNGISMDCKVSLTDMRIGGTASSGKMELLLRALLSLVHKRKISMQDFEYYRRCEALRQEAFRISTDGIYAVMDSVMCPDFHYPLTRNMDRLSADLPVRAGSYFDARFRNSADGVLYIDGKIDEDALRKLLCRYLGGFQNEGRFSVRPKVPYQLRSGWSTYTVDRELSNVGDGSSSTSMAIAVQRPFSMKAWSAFRIAVEALRRQLVVELAPLGQYADVKTSIQLFPTEKFAVFLNARACSPDGLPIDVELADPYETLAAMRNAVGSVSENGIGAADLAGYKAALAHELDEELSDPEFLMDAYLLRLSGGKDIVSNCKEHLASVTVEDIDRLLREFDDAGKVEYILK